MEVRIATCTVLPEVDPDAVPLAEAFERAGCTASLVAWDDPLADWNSPTPTIIRSTWNYATHPGSFIEWARRVSKTAPLFNPIGVIEKTLPKRYLLTLAHHAIPTVPTIVVEHHQKFDMATLQYEGVVIKPEIGAGSLQVKMFSPRDPNAFVHLEKLTAHGAALVQPYLKTVETYGERSLIFIDGKFSHAIRKFPRFAGDDERVEGPVETTNDERTVAERAVALFGQLLYARVDLVPDHNQKPVVMELELIEPSLYFSYKPGSADAYVAALQKRITSQ